MSFLYEYMNEDELAFAREQAQFENESLHLENAFSILCMEHNVRLNDIETQVLLENYSDDNLTEMYTKEMAIFMEGVQDWWKKFKEWVKGIWNAILGKVQKVDGDVRKAATDVDEEIELPVDPSRLKKITTAVSTNLKKITTFKNPDGSYDTGKIIGAVCAAVGAGAGIAGITTYAKNNTKVKAKEAVKILDDFKNDSKELTDTALGIDETSVAAPAIQSLVAKVTSLISEGINAITTKLPKLLSKGKSDIGKIAGDTVKAIGTAKDAFSKKDKQAVKSEMIRIAKNWGILDKTKGNKIDVNDMQAIYNKVVEKMKSGSTKNITDDMVGKWRDIIKWMKDNNIFEFTLDDIEGSYYAEFGMDSMEDISTDFDVEAFLESHDDSAYEELCKLVDAL